MPKLRKPKYQLAEVRKEAFPYPILPHVWWQAAMTATQSSHRQQGKDSVYLFWQWGHTFRGISTRILHLLPTPSSTASLVTRGCFARRNVVSCVLLALFWEPDSRSNGMLQCQAVNSWQEMVPAACPGREDACAPVKGALVSGLGREADARF